MFIRDGEKFMISTPDTGPNTAGLGQKHLQVSLNDIRQKKIKFKIKLAAKIEK